MKKPVDISEYQYLLNRIRSLPPMTIEERRRQAISFAYGNAKLSNPNVTREMVEIAHEELHPAELRLIECEAGQCGYEECKRDNVRLDGSED